MKQPLTNPFLLTGYHGKQYFCDRQAELNLLRENIQNERNTVLYSWRRMGKTALIQAFFQDIQSQKSTETVYVDLMTSKHLDDAIRQITKSIHEQYGKSKSGLSATLNRLFSKLGATISFDLHTGEPKINFTYATNSVPERSLEALGDFLSNRKNKVIVALDEFQQVTNFKESNGEAAFRSWMQAFPSLRFIFSGSHRQLMTSMFAESNRPFYRSAQLLKIDKIDLSTYKEFIQYHFKKAGKKISSDQIEFIYEWSRGQTYCIQLICNKLYAQTDEVTEVLILNVQAEILDQEKPIFGNYTKLLTNNQWNLLKAIAKEEPLSNPQSSAFITKYQLGAASTVGRSLHMLQDKEIVVEENDQYFVHDVLLARWLQSI